MYKKLRMIVPFVVIGVLSVVVIIGYSRSDDGEPIRVLFRTKGGPVVFSHKSHMEYESDCTRCHHNGGDDDQWACRSCHAPDTEYASLCEDRPIHKQCIGANCLDCHKEMGMDGSDCAFCHR